MPAEDRNIALARFGERHLHDLDAAAVEHREREVVDAAEAERRNLQLAGTGLRGFFKIGPGFEFAVLLHKDERRALDHHCNGRDVIHGPAGALAGEQRVTVGDVNRHRITVGRRRQKLRHARRAGATGYVDDRYALTEHRLHQLADEAGELIGAATRAPRDDQFDRALRIAGRNGLAAEQRGERHRHKHYEASRRTHGLILLPWAACRFRPARGRAWQGRWSGL